NGLAKANLHGANDQKVLAGGDRESVGAGFTDSGICQRMRLGSMSSAPFTRLRIYHLSLMLGNNLL
ncbi:hypothetical protein BIS09_15225, partial [Halomonas sp. R1t8]|uniref:hypothetical protein n=1 Tax=unclassified Halomonas TaxID=2609666 RepID=UPI00209F4212